jgi:hypothetical protein
MIIILITTVSLIQPPGTSWIHHYQVLVLLDFASPRVSRWNGLTASVILLISGVLSSQYVNLGIIVRQAESPVKLLYVDTSEAGQHEEIGWHVLREATDVVTMVCCFSAT